MAVKVTCPASCITLKQSAPPIRKKADMRESKFTEEQVIGFLEQAKAGVSAQRALG